MKQVNNYPKLNLTDSIRQIILICAVVAFCSLFYFNFFVEGFIITISVIALPLLLYFNETVHALSACLAVAVASPTFRYLTLIVGGATAQKSFQTTWPEVFFYAVYGLVFYWLYTRTNRKFHYFIITVFCSDLIANTFEMGLRLADITIPLNIFRGLALVALLRTTIVIMLLYAFIRLKRLMIEEENRGNYANLLVMTSNFWSEIYFLQKNTVYIEQLMAKAFNLYKYAEQHAANQTIINKSLDLAKEVHEVKKDYLRVIKGLEAITEKKLYKLSMSIDQIIDIIVDNSRKTLQSEGIAIAITTDVHSTAKVYYHFYMTSVLQNIMSNAIEALDEKENGKISISAHEAGEKLLIDISDNGCGIKARDIKYIFNPGYSSKYSEQSGDAKRGLGLNIVKNIVEQEFDGKIEVVSQVDQGTCFSMIFPIESLKGE